MKSQPEWIFFIAPGEKLNSFEKEILASKSNIKRTELASVC